MAKPRRGFPRVSSLPLGVTKRRVVFWGFASALLSAAGTYAYLVSLFLVPVFIFVLWIVIRVYRRIPEPKSAIVYASVGLAEAAVLMPVVAWLGLASNWYEPFVGPGWTTHALFYTLAPAAIVLVSTPLVAIVVGRLRSPAR